MLVSRVEHDAGGAHLRRSGHGIEDGQCVREQHEDETDAERYGTERLEAGLRISAGKQPELHIVDAAGRAVDDGADLALWRQAALTRAERYSSKTAAAKWQAVIAEVLA